MSRKRRPTDNLRDLSACLTGRLPDEIDWDGVVEMANRSLTITSLASSVLRAHPDPPEDVRSYLTAILGRNTERNSRLLVQLDEAAACLNEIGLEPIVSKGAAILVEQRETAPGSRLLSDLDLLVPPEAFPAAIRALERIGYGILKGGKDERWPGNSRYRMPVVLARGSDAGSIDLQSRLKGPVPLSDVVLLGRDSQPISLGAGVIRIPTPAHQVYALVLHDQLQEGDYLRGLLDLRHLLDIALLAERHVLDLGQIRRLFDAPLARKAFDLQLESAALLFPGQRLATATSTHQRSWEMKRRLAQLDHPWLRVPLTLFSFLRERPRFHEWERFGGELEGGLLHMSRRRFYEWRRLLHRIPQGKVT